MYRSSGVHFSCWCMRTSSQQLFDQGTCRKLLKVACWDLHSTGTNCSTRRRDMFATHYRACPSELARLQPSTGAGLDALARQGSGRSLLYSVLLTSCHELETLAASQS